jgi:hypothetical protein
VHPRAQLESHISFLAYIDFSRRTHGGSWFAGEARERRPFRHQTVSQQDGQHGPVLDRPANIRLD